MSKLRARILRLPCSRQAAVAREPRRSLQLTVANIFVRGLFRLAAFIIIWTYLWFTDAAANTS